MFPSKLATQAAVPDVDPRYPAAFASSVTIIIKKTTIATEMILDLIPDAIIFAYTKEKQGVINWIKVRPIGTFLAYINGSNLTICS